MLSYTVITTNRKAYAIFVAVCVALLIVASIVFSVVGSFIRTDDQEVQIEVQSLTIGLKERVSLPDRLEESRQKKKLQLYTPVQHPEKDSLGKQNPFVPLFADVVSAAQGNSSDEDETAQQQADTSGSVREIVIPPSNSGEPTAPNIPAPNTGDSSGTPQT